MLNSIYKFLKDKVQVSSSEDYIEIDIPIQNKVIHFEYQKNEYKYFDLLIKLNFAGADHAGLKTMLATFSRQFSFNIYDSRHWDYDNDCWFSEENNSYKDENHCNEYDDDF